MSLSNDVVFPQYLVISYLRDSEGALVRCSSLYVFCSRSEALRFIAQQNFESQISKSVSSASLEPVFRLYHLTRAKY